MVVQFFTVIQQLLSPETKNVVVRVFCYLLKRNACMGIYLWYYMMNAIMQDIESQQHSTIAVSKYVSQEIIFIFVRMHDYCVAAYVPISTTTHRLNSLAPHCITYL